jgi:hypothetical protein
MWEFSFGFLAGAFISRLFSKQNSKTRDAMVQADDVVIAFPRTEAVPVPKTKFVRGSLSNFWGSDS